MTQDEKFDFFKEKIGNKDTEYYMDLVPTALSITFFDDEEDGCIDLFYVIYLDREDGVWNWVAKLETVAVGMDDYDREDVPQSAIQRIKDEPFVVSKFGKSFQISDNLQWTKGNDTDGWFNAKSASVEFLIWIFEHAVDLDGWANNDDTNFKNIKVSTTVQRELNEDTYVEPKVWGTTSMERYLSSLPESARKQLKEKLSL